MIRVVKRNFEEEDFSPHKLTKWAEWSADKLPKVDWFKIVGEVVSNLPDTVTSTELQNKLIRQCLLKKRFDYNKMAGKLYICLKRKEMYMDGIPTIKTLHQRMIEDNVMVDMGYSDLEYYILEENIDHQMDLEYTHDKLDYFIHKYSLQNRVEKIAYETPQFTLMRVCMNVFKTEIHDKLSQVIRLYNYAKKACFGFPTPDYQISGTSKSGGASCCIIHALDEAESIGIANHIAYMMTVYSSGIGNNIDVRSVGDKIRNGQIMHEGVLPYNKMLGSTVTSGKQAGRSGSANSFIGVYHPEARDIVMAQNPLTPAEKSLRDLHFSVMMNKFYLEKVRNNEDIMFITQKQSPELHRLFYTSDYKGFVTEYDKEVKRLGSKAKFVSARKLALTIEEQGHEVSTMYTMWIDEVNRHTPFKEPIRSSNLCVAPETKILTKDGYKEIASLKDSKVEVWNGEEFSEVTIRQTGINQKLLKIGFSNGSFIECTEYHRFPIGIDMIHAKDLSVGAEIISYTLPVDKTDYIQNVHGIKITSIEDLGRYSDTYCFTEPKRGMGIFNGILTGNCMEILIPTYGYKSMEHLYSTTELIGKHGYEQEPEVGICSLFSDNVDNDLTDEEYYDMLYLGLKKIDNNIDNNHYPFPHIKMTAQSRRNAGVGIVGLASLLARKGLKYTSKEGLAEIHRVAERHMYFLIKASIQLGRERGNAKWMHKTKWVDGWTPLETYARTVDEITPAIYHYDWVALKKELIQNGGMRFSSLCALMPTESSAKALGVPNGPYPIRELALDKSDAGNVIKWVAPNNDENSYEYELAYDITPTDMIKVYAVLQKFCDQGISADLYYDRRVNGVKESDMLEKLFLTHYYGMKTTYYVNSLTNNTNNQDKQKEEPKKGCDSGACDV